MDEDEQAEVRSSREERTEHVESILEETETLLEDERKYPTRREELAEEYADQEIDLPNETESLGSVFDRLSTERFESPGTGFGLHLVREIMDAYGGDITIEDNDPTGTVFEITLDRT